MHPAIDRLPDAFAALLPELAALHLPAERTADCGACVMVAPRTPDELAFHAEIRCCTYHPRLPNFLVGRILRRGGVGAEKARARIALEVGVSRFGIDPPAGWTADYDRRVTAEYGHAPDLVCPYWVPGELGCSIWQDRGAVCRTWFCRHDDGHRGHATWAMVRRALRQVEIRLANAVAHEPVGGWEACFVRCAEAVDALPLDGLGVGLEPIREALAATAAARAGAIPELLEPTVEGSRELPGGKLWLWGYSAFDGRAVDAAGRELLRRFEERRPWREIVAGARAEGVAVDEGVVADWFGARILGPRA